MSVEIYEVDTEMCLLCIGVAGEHTFQMIWEQAIADCGLRYIGNGVFLYRKDLQAILREFEIVQQYMTAHHHTEIAKKTAYIRQVLQEEWTSEIQRLYMG